jgi:hypothetical protein
VSFNPKESAEWALAADGGAEKLAAGVDKALADAAGRGFPAPPGETLSAILTMGLETKASLVQANGKIYDEGRARLFQVDEFALKVIVRLAKLGMELYRERLFNALALEEAQAQAVAERSRADVERLNSETEARMAAVIRAKAKVEQGIIAFKGQLVAAERESLAGESLLINAQLETAQAKLAIINSIYQVIAAEELVLAAERRRAASLEKVLVAQEAVAAIKKEMVPFHLAKAEAREQLAVAVTKEAAVREDIERLGYDRLELKRAEENVNHQVRQAEEDHEVAQQARVRAEKVRQVAQIQFRRLLQEYHNRVQADILELRKVLEKDGVDFKLDTHLARVEMGVDEDVALLDHERDLVGQELNNLLRNLEAAANDQATTIRESANTKSITDHYHYIGRRIIKGFITSRGGGGRIGPNY